MSGIAGGGGAGLVKAGGGAGGGTGGNAAGGKPPPGLTPLLLLAPVPPPALTPVSIGLLTDAPEPPAGAATGALGAMLEGAALAGFAPVTGALAELDEPADGALTELEEPADGAAPAGAADGPPPPGPAGAGLGGTPAPKTGAVYVGSNVAVARVSATGVGLAMGASPEVGVPCEQAAAKMAALATSASRPDSWVAWCFVLTRSPLVEMVSVREGRTTRAGRYAERSAWGSML